MMGKCFEILLWGIMWFIIGMVVTGILALIGIGITGLISKIKRRARDRRKEREAAWAAHSMMREVRERSEE